MFEGEGLAAQFVRARLVRRASPDTDVIYSFLCFKDTVYSEKEKYNAVRREFNLLLQEYSIAIEPYVSATPVARAAVGKCETAIHKSSVRSSVSNPDKKSTHVTFWIYAFWHSIYL